MFLVNQICEGFKFVANKGLEGLERTVNATFQQELPLLEDVMVRTAQVIFMVGGASVIGMFISPLWGIPMQATASALWGPEAGHEAMQLALTAPVVAAFGGIGGGYALMGASACLDKTREVELHLPRLAMAGAG